VAILRDLTSDSSAALAAGFRARVQELGGAVVAEEGYRAGDRDVKAQLATLAAADPRAVYVPGSWADAAVVARQARELGMAQTLLGADGWDAPKLFEAGGGALEGAYFSDHFSSDEPQARVRDFVKRYREAWGEAPDAFAAMGYDAARVAMDAMRRAPELTGPAIRDALAATKGFPGVSGAITIGPEHDASKPAVVLQVKGGAARYAATVNP
jgi:branched-chain amino acid transport system substrate-binding protein